MADYKELPYIFQNHTYASGNHNLAEDILAPLFNKEFQLKAGLHLHWSLPDALTNGEHDENGTTFPQVPNRWLVLRKGGYQGEKQWIIESDYLYPIHQPGDNSQPPDAINILIQPPNLANVNPDDPSTYQYQRYRYMGRTWELGQYNQWEHKEYAPDLTAMGNRATIPILDAVQGTFAAFYPNCHSVFGFHDSDYCVDTPPSGLYYDVIGWYSNGQQDCLQKFLAENSGKSNEELLEILQEEFNWTIDGSSQIPQQTLYHSRITFSGSGDSAEKRIRDLSKPTIAVSNSAPEALSAYLANIFSANDSTVRQAVEEKLEALHISERLESRNLDLGAKFREGRHERGFGTENDGFLWSIVPQISGNENPGTKANQVTQVTLPANLAHQLNQLNVLQEQYNQAWLDIESLRRELYGQWYYFMTHKDEHDENGNSLYYDLNDASLVSVKTAIAQAGELAFSNNGGNTTVTAKTLAFGVTSKLDDKWNDDKYFSCYVELMELAARGTFDDADYNWTDISSEFTTYGVQLSPRPYVATITNREAWRISDRGQSYDVKVEEGIFNIYIPPNNAQTAQKIVNAMNSLLRAISSHNNSSDVKYRLTQFPSQNYWRANDPVILFEGDSAKASNRFGQDGRLNENDHLECHPIDIDINNITSNIRDLENKINSLNPGNGREAINFITWNQQPWNPFAFHWSILYYPSRNVSNGDVQNYSTNQILDNYSLEPNAIDLQLKSGRQSSFVSSANTYSGFSILTPSASLNLTKRLTNYLTQQLTITADHLSQNIVTIKNNYQSQHGLSSSQAQANDPIFVALWAYEQMQNRHCQAQAIGGFNDTLLVAQPSFPLQVDDPLTTDPFDQIVTEQIRWALGDSLQYQINYGDIFNPIRSGAMSINKLWLIDSFGQPKEVIPFDNTKSTTVVTSSQMTPPSNNNYQVLLPPRLAQPARLNFHWLAADAINEVEMTTSPARNPVCGWIVPNNLDSNLGIYDAQGKALGLIDTAGHWRNSPSSNISVDRYGHPDLSSINFHLNKMVHYLLEQGTSFQQQFISSLDNSLENIDPESFAEHPSLALLVGRPIALVRTTFSLEVKGLRACDPQVRLTSQNQAPATHGFEGVKFPIRLGDYRQLNDGLVGYWRETPVQGGNYSYEGNVFYATQSNLHDNTNLIQTEAEGLVYFEQTVDAPPQGVTMLIDPRGLIHATCGILPNQELRLPPENYSQALQNIEVNFLSTPILCNHGEIDLPLPKEAEYVWHWLSLNGQNWSETATIEPVNTKATFSKPQQLYEGWLQLNRVQD
jgi:hypothetical protein